MNIKVNNLTFAYTQKIVLNKLTFAINSGDFLTIVGKNGSGKSTFIKCLLKLVKIADDTIFLNDQDINKIQRFQNVGYVPQRIEFSYEFPITVSEVLSSAYLHRKDAYYTSVINALDLNTFYRENVNTLSGGQLQRVFIARALLNHPKLLILDEPTVGVDLENIKGVVKILTELKKQGVTIIISTHEIEYVRDLTDYFLSMSDFGEYRFVEAGKWN
ncbi:MAG TPA: ATP-binding cassette domain-containing protein [Bacilli bacterium]|nr:MAG: Arginine transport ATP-binding protein ArtM [Tenericutes bacterium ADurb.BinA124]HNZ50138.1 ATP-binding cassette domain-containing protein [Bacilli bacterium]HPX84044.1 ATP-binding cassette domain-containing protein [Bacilli bacterium]HQC74054.1 ATP-binding cassette domain-containing protein [Bacilli bacterium]